METPQDSTQNDKTNTAASAAPPNKEELLELVRAIKFANTEWSQRQVHNEIVETLSQEVPCLKDVKLNNVKKVWKKAVIAVREGEGQQKDTEKDTKKEGGEEETKEEVKKEEEEEEEEKSNTNESSTSNGNADLAKLLEGQTPQVFTVGDASQVYPELAKFYTSNLLAKEVAKVDQEMAEDAKTYVHVYLDVPADKSGKAPHQALINFQKGNNSSSKQNKKNGGGDNDLKIVKIQKAAPLSETDKTQHPMLVYNRGRSLRTFIHPAPTMENNDNDSVKPDDSYDKIAKMIDQGGIGGALGGAGGSKAYFYARLTQSKKGPDILSIDHTRLAPAQEW